MSTSGAMTLNQSLGAKVITRPMFLEYQGPTITWLLHGFFLAQLVKGVGCFTARGGGSTGPPSDFAEATGFPFEQLQPDGFH